MRVNIVLSKLFATLCRYCKQKAHLYQRDIAGKGKFLIELWNWTPFQGRIFQINQETSFPKVGILWSLKTCMGPANFCQFCRNKKGFCHMINLVENSVRGKSLNARCRNSITAHRHFLEAFAMYSNNYECKMSLPWNQGWSLSSLVYH